MWIYRRILNAPQTDRITSEEILHRIGKERELLAKIKKRRHLGHIMKNSKYTLLQLISEGKYDDKTGVNKVDVLVEEYKGMHWP